MLSERTTCVERVIEKREILARIKTIIERDLIIPTILKNSLAL
jgi:hypothetical protein